VDYLAFILKNQLTAEKWGEIAEDMPFVLGNHAKLIRDIASLVLEDKVGRGDARKEYLGVYYDEVQRKVNWVCTTAEDVWAGKYGNDAERKEKLGADYEIVMAQVNRTAHLHNHVTIASAPKYTSADGIYTYKNVPSKRGKITMYGFNQHKQGSNPYVFDGSGCGFMSFYSVIATIKGYTTTPLYYANKNLKSAGGTKCPISSSVGINMLKAEKIQYKWLKHFNTKELTEVVKAHLHSGQPAIISLYKNNRAGKETKRYTNYAHYAVLTHMKDDGKSAWLNDPGGRLPRFVDLYDICDHCPEASDKVTFSAIWNGFSNCGGVILVYM